MPSIRLLIADDHRLFRQGLCQMCEDEADFEVVGEAENGQEAVTLARQLQPDVILMDVQMPLLDGLQATRLIVEESPAARIIIMTVYQKDEYAAEAIKVGAWGYLLKGVAERIFIEAIRAVSRGETVPGVQIARKLTPQTPRTREVIEWELALKAWQDETFMLALRANPRVTIAAEYGIEIPDHIDIHLVEESSRRLYLRLPAHPDDLELSDEQLDQVAGGLNFWSIFTIPS